MMNDSGYEAYDRLSPALRVFLEGLTAVHNADFFIEVCNFIFGVLSFRLYLLYATTKYAKKQNLPIQEHRGSPENTGTDLTAVQ